MVRAQEAVGFVTTHRPQVGPFYGLCLSGNPKKELLGGLWQELQYELRVENWRSSLQLSLKSTMFRET